LAVLLCPRLRLLYSVLAVPRVSIVFLFTAGG
jgi:hypothetical protein